MACLPFQKISKLKFLIFFNLSFPKICLLVLVFAKNQKQTESITYTSDTFSPNITTPVLLKHICIRQFFTKRIFYIFLQAAAWKRTQLYGIGRGLRSHMCGVGALVCSASSCQLGVWVCRWQPFLVCEAGWVEALLICIFEDDNIC